MTEKETLTLCDLKGHSAAGGDGFLLSGRCCVTVRFLGRYLDSRCCIHGVNICEHSCEHVHDQRAFAFCDSSYRWWIHGQYRDLYAPKTLSKFVSWDVEDMPPISPAAWVGGPKRLFWEGAVWGSYLELVIRLNLWFCFKDRFEISLWMLSIVFFGFVWSPRFPGIAGFPYDFFMVSVRFHGFCCPSHYFYVFKIS